MKLAPEQIETIATLILKRLADKKLIIFKADEDKVHSRVVRAITDNLKDEDDLDREIESLIEGQSGTEDAEGVDRRRVFNMIKHKLARERDIIL